MGKELFNRDDVIKRLHQTICMYKGEPVYVTADCEGRTKVLAYPLKEFGANRACKPIVVNYTDDSFSYKSPPLGYIYYNDRAFYLSRIPDRKQRQGLHQEVIFSVPTNDEVPWIEMLQSPEMHMCIMGRHPSLMDARVLIAKGARSVPISRNCAVQRLGKSSDMVLLYKGREIGISMGGKDFELYNCKEKGFLTKVLQREGIYPC